MGTSRDTASGPQGKPHDKGSNLGQGLANITDKDRLDLAGRGDDAPTKDRARAQSGRQDQRSKDNK